MLPQEMAGKHKTKRLKVMIVKGLVEEFTVDHTDADLTVGWLLSEVTRRYDKY